MSDYDIVIVGGGSAGWITANVLHAQLSRAQIPPRKIAVVESPDIPTIGVGEATVPSIRRTLSAIGLAEREFLEATDATFKMLIRFVDWADPLGDAYDHPFDRRERPATDDGVAGWLAASAGQRAAYAPSVSILSHMASEGRGPKVANWPDFSSVFPYAYHLDAVKFAQLLTRRAIAAGVVHIIDDVVAVGRDATGAVASLRLRSGDHLYPGLVVDCTGFAAAIIDSDEKGAVESFSNHLLCDRAVAAQIPLAEDAFLPPFTTATAREAGWTWDIHLKGRRGAGYVYSSAHCSSDMAEQAFRRWMGVPDTVLVRHIPFESRKRKLSWAHNVVAIGLSDGFLEPLESTGLYLTEFAAFALADQLSTWDGPSDVGRRLFNQQLLDVYAECAAFVNLHYVASPRRDTEFWRDATAAGAVIPWVADRLALWRRRPPTDLDFPAAHRLFSLESFEYVLFGLGVRPAGRQGAVLPPIGAAVEKSLAKFPSHRELIAAYRSRM